MDTGLGQISRRSANLFPLEISGAFFPRPYEKFILVRCQRRGDRGREPGTRSSAASSVSASALLELSGHQLHSASCGRAGAGGAIGGLPRVLVEADASLQEQQVGCLRADILPAQALSVFLSSTGVAVYVEVCLFGGVDRSKKYRRAVFFPWLLRTSQVPGHGLPRGPEGKAVAWYTGMGTRLVMGTSSVGAPVAGYPPDVGRAVAVRGTFAAKAVGAPFALHAPIERSTTVVQSGYLMQMQFGPH
ncbi:hypothetical protein CYMTET_39243 [Cymbomonas tetramitiformis]|uniref:Uncharacterized protein n=1 Tax=Cymbomonas tetramitiformis TaxID=36881 RepID=A0AAE0CBT2_9CHLO|nr:hypothetical protein CYMTET_39243 [Cymbomonas tetramitiformis]